MYVNPSLYFRRRIGVSQRRRCDGDGAMLVVVAGGRVSCDALRMRVGLREHTVAQSQLDRTTGSLVMWCRRCCLQVTRLKNSSGICRVCFRHRDWRRTVWKRSWTVEHTDDLARPGLPALKRSISSGAQLSMSYQVSLRMCNI